MVVPFLSIILLEAGWSNSNITYFFSIFVLAAFLFSPGIGKLSDIFGRKKIIYFGLILQIIFFYIYFAFNNIYLIYVARFLDGIAFTCVSIVSFSAFEDMISERRGFWTGIFLSIGTIGAILGPIIAGFIATKFLIKSLLIVSIIFCIFSVFILSFIEEKKSKIKNQIKLKDLNPLKEIKKFFYKKELRAIGFLGILMNSKGQIYSIFFPIFVITTLHLPKYYLGFLIAIPSFFHIFQFYYGRISDKISSQFGVLLGVFLVCWSIFFLPYIDDLFGLIVLLIFYGIGGGIWNVSAWTLMGNVAKEESMEGEVVGAYFSIAKLGSFFATLVSAYIIDIFGISRTLQLFSIAIIIGNCVAYLLFKPIFHTKERKSSFYKVIG